MTWPLKIAMFGKGSNRMPSKSEEINHTKRSPTPIMPDIISHQAEVECKSPKKKAKREFLTTGILNYHKANTRASRGIPPSEFDMRLVAKNLSNAYDYIESIIDGKE